MLTQIHHAIGVASARIADFAGHAVVQVTVLAASVLWLVAGQSEGALASTMTIGGFILTQMILNQQRRRENALHLKIDELLHAIEGARSEVAGAEHESETRIEELRRDQPPRADEALYGTGEIQGPSVFD